MRSLVGYSSGMGGRRTVSVFSGLLNGIRRSLRGRITWTGRTGPVPPDIRLLHDHRFRLLPITGADSLGRRVRRGMGNASLSSASSFSTIASVGSSPSPFTSPLLIPLVLGRTATSCPDSTSPSSSSSSSYICECAWATAAAISALMSATCGSIGSSAAAYVTAPGRIALPPDWSKADMVRTDSSSSRSSSSSATFRFFALKLYFLWASINHQSGTATYCMDGCEHVGVGLPVWVVCSHVLRQRCPSREGFLAFRIFALVGSLPCVRPPMSSETA